MLELRDRSVIELKEEEVGMEKRLLHNTLLGDVNLLYTMLKETFSGRWYRN